MYTFNIQCEIYVIFTCYRGVLLYYVLLHTQFIACSFARTRNMGAITSVPWTCEPVVEQHQDGAAEWCEDFRFSHTNCKSPVPSDSSKMLKRKIDFWSFTVDRKGRILTIPEEGITVVVPDDALPHDDDKPTIIKLGICRGMTSDFEVETQSIALSPTIVLEPHGLVFLKPVYLFLPTYAFPRLCRLPDTKLLCRWV